ncbi:hypothetical protein ONZ45_g2335 [Pleurotus djamor]|nr:hypothetical protein ONZ45_g16990 [Pleurotus djamor]KAJ8520944.1 hypothetical protein ONZ45_g2335 [Pleurotus djamor]
MAESSKPKLYTFGGSVWSAAPELAIRELGYSSDDINTETVNLVLGENFKPSFIKINPNATLPTLEAGGQVYTNTNDVIDYLVKHAPKNVKTGNPEFIKEVHEDSIDPNFALLLARNPEELSAKVASLPYTFVYNRQVALKEAAASEEGKEFAQFYAAKIAGNGGLLDIYEGRVPADAFFKQSQDHFANVVSYLSNSIPKRLPAESVFIGGSTPGEDDFHLAAWLARIAATSGAVKTEEGLEALKNSIGSDLPPKVVAYWKAWADRDSWKEVYAQGLH